MKVNGSNWLAITYVWAVRNEYHDSWVVFPQFVKHSQEEDNLYNTDTYTESNVHKVKQCGDKTTPEDH